MPPIASAPSPIPQSLSSEHKVCTQDSTLSVEMPGGRSTHVALRVDEGMVTLVVVLAFLAVAAFGLVTAVVLSRGRSGGRTFRRGLYGVPIRRGFLRRDRN